MIAQIMNELMNGRGAAERSGGERSEPARSAAAPLPGAAQRPNPEFRPRGKRRSFTAAYKQKVLTAADAATESGAIGALLRKEGLYSSHLTHWRQERAEGIKKGLTPRTRGPKPDATATAKENQDLRHQNERLTERLRKAEIIIDVQKKVATLLGLTLAEPDPRDLI